MKEETITKIIEFFKNNEEIFNSCVEELDSYNGYIGDDRCYSMEDLNELYSGTEPIELLSRSFYGYDADTWERGASSGEKIYGAFNPNRKYFYFNGYGNFVSSNYKDYSDYLDEGIIKAMSENRLHIDSIEEDEELSLLFDELEAAEEEE